jgi:uncharacterized membrane protein
VSERGGGRDCAKPSALPPHIDRTVQSLAQLHADHHQNATRAERLTKYFTGLLGRPVVIAVIALLVLCWLVANSLAPTLGYHSLDPPPFVWLSGAISLTSLFIVVLVLATQRRDDELAQRRDQLTLELAILSEQKAAKIIQLIEEARRDNPLIANRIDEEAEQMAQPADPQHVLSKIDETHAAAEERQADGA